MKQAILVVSFGTSYVETRKRCIDSVEESIQRAFPDVDVHRAFTSHFIIKKLKERDGLHIYTVKEALDHLREEGYTNVYVQPLHMIPGHEYDKLKRVVVHYDSHAFNVLKLGKPLLYDTQDYPKVVEALRIQTKEAAASEVILMMGHGTDHYVNGLYLALQHFIDRTGLHIIIGNVEGYPELDDLLPRLKAMKVNRISLMPLMLVAGDHAQNDMAGEDADSWLSQLTEAGFHVETFLKGLGENPAIHELFIEKVHELMS